MQKTGAQIWHSALHVMFKLAWVLFAIWLIYLLSPILLPFLISALIAYMCNPLVERLMRFRLSRRLAASIVFGFLLLIVCSLILLLIPLIQKQIEALIATIPSMMEYAQTKLSWLQEYFGININQEIGGTIKGATSADVASATGIVSSLLQTMLRSGKAIFETILSIVLIPVVTFYFLRDWDLILTKIRQAIPKQYKSTVMQLAEECDWVLSGFLRGQFLLMLAMSVMYAIGLTIIGLQVGIILGVIFGLISIVPYLGLIVGIIVASIAALVQFGTFSSLLWVWLVFFIVQIIADFYLTPKLIGKRIGLHPVVVIFAVLAGGVLFGFFGILLALPVSAILVVILRYYTHLQS